LCCWSPKGGSGTSVVAAGLARLLAVVHGSSLLVDLGGDAPAVLGVPGPQVTGDAPASFADREVAAGEGVSLLPLGPRWSQADEADAPMLVSRLRAEARPVVVDLPTLGTEARADRPLRWFDEVAGARSLLVVRPCYLALRRVTSCGERPDGVVVVREPGRALRTSDVCEVAGAPLLAEIPHHPSIARVVDAGLLASRLPAVLERALRPVVAAGAPT
jgi:hypothetical protein